MQIAIVLYPGFTALDFIGPYEVLRSLPDAEVRFVWHEPGPIAADSGVLLVGATHSFDETPSPDIVLVPGGMSTFEHARDEKVLDMGAPRTRDEHVDDVGVLRIGDPRRGRAVEGQAGHVALDGGADAQAVRRLARRRRADRGRGRHSRNKIVTCAGVSAGLDMALWLAGQIVGESKAKAIQLVIEYDPQPPFDSGHLSKASTATKALATAALSKDMARTGQLTAPMRLLWDRAINAVRTRGKKHASSACVITRAPTEKPRRNRAGGGLQ